MSTGSTCGRFTSSTTRERDRAQARGIGLARFSAPAAALATHRRPSIPSATAQAYAARRLDAADLDEWLAAHGSRASSRGWSSADLALVALYYQPSVERARAGWLAVRAAERTAGARPQPDLQSETGYATSAEVFQSRWYASVNAIFTLELGGKRGARVSAARARTAVAETDLEDTAWRAGRVVRAAAVELGAARERLADAVLGVERTSAFAERLRRRYAEGTLSRSELAAVESEEADARAAAIREREAVAAATGALARTAGLPSEALDSVALVADCSRRVQLPGWTVSRRSPCAGGPRSAARWRSTLWRRETCGSR